MSGRYRTYPEYKKSEIDWLGDIPEHWKLVRFKNIFKIKKRIAGRLGFEILSITQRGIKIKDTESGDGQLSMDYSKYQLVYKNDFAMNHMDLLTGFVDISKYDGVTSPDYRVFILEDKSSHQRYFLYLLQLCYIAKIFYPLGQGAANIGRWRLPSEAFNEFIAPIPTLEEQTVIANFLDHETAKIDTLIEKQQQLIQLLKEKRQAVISHAVTKGLNPDVPMRDSGVNCFGEVPQHWIVCRLKHIKSTEQNAFVDGPFGSNLKSEHFKDDGDVYVIESNFATTGKIDTSNLKKISKQHFETIKRSSTKSGDIILAKIGARYGSSSILPDLDREAVVSGNSLKLTVNDALIRNEYANELLRHLKENDAMDDGVNITAQPALSLGGLNNIPFLQVPLNEQDQIIDFLDKTKALFDTLILKAEHFISLSQERRTALISAAVTGKIDVRNWQPPKTNTTEAA